MQVEVARCGSCHSEHHGPQLALVSGAAFERAGVQDVVHYDHAGLGYGLGGKHLDLECVQCHENSDVRLLEKGKRRFLGESQACTSCHADPHEGRLPDCKSCHGEERPFPEAPNFRHTERFPLAGAHAGLACVRCHATPGQYSGAKSDCSACHASPHAANFLAREAACERCHPIQAGGFAREGVVFPRERHADSGFALVPPHDKQECKQCHAPELPYRESHPGRTLENCAACHADVHKGQFGARACRECHGAESWKPALFGAAAHARTEFPLEGQHANTKCADCHRERFVGTQRECVACHADVHKGQFGTRGCRECHGLEAWKPSRYDAAAHARSGFALEGTHATTKCADCHVERFAGTPRECAACHADVHKGQFGARGCRECHGTGAWKPSLYDLAAHARSAFPLEEKHALTKCADCHVERFAGTPRECADCHADVHKSAFREPTRGCTECHTQKSWMDRRETFDHQHWTGFALEGRHLEAGCQACHTPRAPGRACAACHADPHVGQFALAGATDCARCHVGASDFRAVGFDHQRDSRFAIDATHKHVACNGCHRASPLQGGGSAVRYKPLGTLCGDCHDTRR
jgi:hypothetical protein